MQDEEINSLFFPLYAPIQNLVQMKERPLLAHYTSLEVLEKIITSNELWFSNPLFMNDLHLTRCLRNRVQLSCQVNIKLNVVITAARKEIGHIALLGVAKGAGRRFCRSFAKEDWKVES